MLIPRCLLPADNCLAKCSRVSVDATWSPMSFGSAGSRRLCTDGIQCVYSLQCRDGNDDVPLSNVMPGVHTVDL